MRSSRTTIARCASSRSWWTPVHDGDTLRSGEAFLKHYLLFYDVGQDFVDERGVFRAAHLEKAWRAHERGELLLGGALADPVDGAVLLFKGESPQVAEAFAQADPYVTGGLVLRWRVREWTTVAGADAANPIRP